MKTSLIACLSLIAIPVLGSSAKADGPDHHGQAGLLDRASIRASDPIARANAGRYGDANHPIGTRLQPGDTWAKYLVRQREASRRSALRRRAEVLEGFLRDDKSPTTVNMIDRLKRAQERTDSYLRGTDTEKTLRETADLNLSSF